MKPVFRLILSILAGLMSCTGIFAQDVHLNMKAEDFIKVFGSPDEETGYDTDEGYVRMLFYGDDFFSFYNNCLKKINVITPRFTLNIFGSDSIKVGDSFAKLLEHSGQTLELVSSVDDHKTYSFITGDGVNESITISLSGDVIRGFNIEKKYSEDSFKQEFKLFFETSFNPSAVIPDNTSWPGNIKPMWGKAKYSLSQDKSFVICCVPFVSELNTAVLYSGQECPDISRRLVIMKYLDGSERFKQSIVSIIPRTGISRGDEFDGLVVYNNVNTGSCFAWECYEDGRLVYSKYPVRKVQEAVSEVNIQYRLGQKVFYLGGESVIPQNAWKIIVSNRMDTTLICSMNFTSGQTDENVKAEKNKYTFSSVLNPDFSAIDFPEEEILTTQNQEKPEDIGQEETSKQEIPDESWEQETVNEETELPKYLGRADNLSGIKRLQNNPVSLAYELRKSLKENNKEQYVLVGTNSDYCTYSIKTETGIIIELLSGKKTIESEIFQYRDEFYSFKGKALSMIDFKFPYALPVASGTKVRMIPDHREKYRSYAVLINEGEQVYAMRSGKLCLTDDPRCILVCHKDGTFAAYMNVDDACVFPGSGVNTGDRIGVCGAGKLSISIFYLDANKLKATAGDMYTHLTPYFRTAEGDVKLETEVEYESLVDTDIITKEMSAGQRKRYQNK